MQTKIPLLYELPPKAGYEPEALHDPNVPDDPAVPPFHLNG